MDADKHKCLSHWQTKPCLPCPAFLPSSVLRWLLFALSAVSGPFTPLCFLISYFYGWNGSPSLLYLVKLLKVLVTQSCLTLCNPTDCSLPDFSVHGFFSQEYWSGLLCPPLGDLPNPGIEPASLRSQELTGGFFTTSVTLEALSISSYI